MGVGESTELGTDYPRSQPRVNTAGRVVLVLSPSLIRWSAGVAEFGGLVLAAFGVVLYRYTGQTALTVGVDLTEQGRGCLRLTLDPGATGGDLLALVRAARVDRTPSPTSVRFADHSIPVAPSPAAEIVLSIDSSVPVLHLDFHEGLFDRDSVIRLGGHLLTVLAALAASRDRPVRDLSLLAEGEREQILGRFNDTERPYDADTPVHRLFSDQVRRTPRTIALTWQDQAMTYQGLEVRANRLARWLREAGVRVGQPVGLLMPRSPELIVTMVAILKAGGAYVPIDPDYPPDRVAYMLDDCGAQVVVVAPESVVGFAFAGSTLRPESVDRADIDGDDSDGGDDDGDDDDGGGDDDGEVRGVTATDPAYVMYTSGTTGRPKGVQVTHRNIARLVRGAEYIDYSARLRILPTSAIGFDASTFEIWGPLLNGGSLHLVSNDIVRNAWALGAELATADITTLWLTSPLFNQLVEQDPAAFRSLRELFTGGDALSAHHVGKAMDACPNLVLINGYGPTENTTFSTTHVIEPADLVRIPIGAPSTNSTAYVLDADDRLCPVGVPGELCVGGAGVALGYLNQPALTARYFVPDPFARGARMYRSGDLARWRSDGVLEFLGRRDQQVKVRGLRIEPGEVETVLLEHPAVLEAVVVARLRGSDIDRYLCGYYVVAAAVGTVELREYLARRLPAHMVPTYLVELAALPLHPNGKLDRGALPEPDSSSLLGRTDYVGPTDEVERVLLDLAERALGTTGIGIHHDLRDLGADSLTATLLAGGIEARFGHRMPVSAVLRAGCVSDIAELLRGSARRAVASDDIANSTIWPAPRLPSYPLTPQQHQLYVEQYKDETAVQYNVPMSLELPSTVDFVALTGALARLTRRHDALRTEFRFDGGEVRQFVRAEVALALDVVEGPAPPARAWVAPFDLGRAPLWRAAVYRTDRGLCLRLDLHHIITDGVSLMIMLEDLAALCAGEDPPSPPLRYVDYAYWLAGPEGTDLRAKQAAYWRKMFARPLPTTDLPVDLPRPAIRAPHGGVVEFDLGRWRTTALRQLARREDVTLFAVLVAVHNALLAKLTGSPDVTIGTPVSGRRLPGLDRTLGMFANTVCLRVTVDPRSRFTELVREIGRTAEEAFAHQDYPLEDLVAWVTPRRGYERSQLFDALIALHSGRYLSVDFAGTRMPLRLEWTGQSVFDLNMQIYETPDSLRVSWQYGAAILRHATVQRWRDAFVDFIDAALGDPDIAVGDCAAASSAETLIPDFEFDL